MTYEPESCSALPARFQGMVDDFPEASETFSQFPVSIGESRLLVRAPHFPEFSYGDHLTLEGKVLEISGKAKNFYATSGICGSMSFPKITLLAKNQGDPLKTFLFRIRKTFTERIQRLFHEPRATLAGSILLGKQGRGAYDEVFRKSGLSHITALSGFNITILIIFIGAWAYFFPRRFRFTLSVFIIVLFVILTGASPSVTRAALMGGFTLFAERLSRLANPLHSLLLAGFFMVLFHPLILRFDLGFQLSFLATLGMILFGKSLTHFFERLKFPKTMKEIFASTLGAQAFTTPLIFITFRTFNPLTIFANFLVIPTIPLIMALTFVSGIAAFLSETAAIFIGFYADLLLRWMIGVAEFFSKFSI